MLNVFDAITRINIFRYTRYSKMIILRNTRFNTTNTKLMIIMAVNEGLGCF